MNLIWWTLIFIFYCGHSWINKQNNDLGGKWLLFAWLISIIPVFPLVARFSKDLLFDGMLFDFIMAFSYIVTLLYLGAGKAFTFVQWAGLALTVIGFVLMKVRL